MSAAWKDLPSTIQCCCLRFKHNEKFLLQAKSACGGVEGGGGVGPGQDAPGDGVWCVLASQLIYSKMTFRKTIWVAHIVWVDTFFWVENKFPVEKKMWVNKLFWVNKYFGSKTNFGMKNNFGSTIFFGSKTYFWSNTFLSWK